MLVQNNWLAIIDKASNVVKILLIGAVPPLSSAIVFIDLLQVGLRFLDLTFNFVNRLVRGHQLICLHYAVLPFLEVSVGVFHLRFQTIQVGLFLRNVLIEFKCARVNLDLRLQSIFDLFVPAFLNELFSLLVVLVLKDREFIFLSFYPISFHLRRVFEQIIKSQLFEFFDFATLVDYLLRKFPLQRFETRHVLSQLNLFVLPSFIRY